MKSICLCFLVLAGAMTGNGAESYPPDNNPALRYWEALMLAARAPQADYDQLTSKDWRGQTLPPKFGDMVSNYNSEFHLLRAAAKSKQPCDWGLDITEGPELLLPHLAQAKASAQIARLRVMWDLQIGQPAEARDDLLATLALARNLPRDGTLISVLVQVAMENILLGAVSENFYQFPPETLKQLEDGFDAAPARGTMAQAITTGERSLSHWFERKTLEARAEHPGDDAAVLASIRSTLQNAMGPHEGGAQAESDTVERMLKAAGGTSDGLLKLLAELSPMYDRATELMSLPRAEFEAQVGPFMEEIKNGTNPFISELFPVITKARTKEFMALTKLAMFHAAVEYALHGETGFAGVTDPVESGPFALERFSVGGAERGFKITSTYAPRGYPETLIFVTKEGAPFFVDGQHAGEPVPDTTAK